MSDSSSSNTDFVATVGTASQYAKLPGDEQGIGDFPYDGAMFMSADDTRRPAQNDDPYTFNNAREYLCKPHYKGFVVFRPWQRCDRCRDALAAGTLVLPPTGEAECTHTMVQEYNAVREEILAGRAFCDPPTQTALRDGTIVITMSWYTRAYKRKPRAVEE